MNVLTHGRVLMLLAGMTVATAVADPITLKGLGPGLPKRQLSALHPGLGELCRTVNDTDACMYTASKDKSSSNIESLDTLEGVPVVEWLLIMRSGSVATVWVKLPASRFDDLVAAMKKRIGPPTKIEKSTVHDFTGATFDKVEAYWDQGESRLRVSKGGSKSDQMVVRLTSREELALGEKEKRPGCAIDDPVVAARMFYADHSAFSSENPDRVRSIVTPRFFSALDREYKCAQGQICALEADPWTDAQDGKIGKPVDFSLASKSGVEARVWMSYPFVLDNAHRKQQRVTLVLQRQSATDCWLIDDLVGPLNESLVGSIEKWHKEYGGH
jgi:hypothetical protein